MIFDIAYVGSKSKNLLRAGADQRGAARRHLPAARTRTRRGAPSSTPGATALPDRPPAALPGLRQHPHVGLRRATPTTTPCRRRSTGGSTTGCMFSVFYVWSKTLGDRQRPTSAPGSRTRATRRTAGLDYSYADYDRPHNFVVNFVYQTPKVASGVARRSWRTTGRSRASTAGRAAGRTPITYSIPGIGNDNLTRHRRQPGRAHRASPATRAAARAAIPTSRSTPRASPRRSRAATASSRPGSSCTAPPINNLDLSISKTLPDRQGDRSSRCASTPSTRSTTPSSRASTPPSTSRA